jgi:hypothetical protein
LSTEVDGGVACAPGEEDATEGEPAEAEAVDEETGPGEPPEEGE